jgi:hypothetical protein
MANGHPERSVARATLASVPSLSSSSMQGHVMPSFTHTLIGLGPFADQGCTIVFTKTAVTVYHPDSHPLLSGWQELDGPRLWHGISLFSPPSKQLPQHHARQPGSYHVLLLPRQLGVSIPTSGKSQISVWPAQ